MLHELGEKPAEDGIDGRPEDIGLGFLVAHFGPEVTEPVRMHVAAKRYLCGEEADWQHRFEIAFLYRTIM